jgi:four helix bundle protein
MIKTYTDLHVYGDSKKLFDVVAEAVQSIPHEHQYVKTQLLRSAQSIHANIAEGFGRSDTEFKQYLRRSLGSNNETLSHLEDAHLLGGMSDNVYENLQKEYTILGKRIYTLREKWGSKKTKPNQTNTKH